VLSCDEPRAKELELVHQPHYLIKLNKLRVRRLIPLLKIWLTFIHRMQVPVSCKLKLRTSTAYI
jgi:hypothetical protein